jgi:hypothetical protein
MPKLVSETIGTGDQSWLGESGPHKARSQALLKSGFTEGTHYPDGFLPSGTPVALNSSTDEYVAYVDGGSNGTGAVAGFVLTDSKVTGDAYINVALLDRGRININKLPITVAAADLAATFIAVEQS